MSLYPAVTDPNEPFDPSANATIAAHQAADALAETLRFIREGNAWPRSPFDNGPVEKLAEAALLLAEIEYEGDAVLDGEDRETLGEFMAACRRFIDGWVG